jgi:FixJ family two-component response regulator
MLMAVVDQSAPIVFVVDDDAALREALEVLIRYAGWRPETFASAHEFLARNRVDVPSCLILDVALPDLSGLDVQKRVVDRVDMPIIFITGHGDVPMSVQAMKAGAVEFLTKPFRDDVLLDAIDHAIDRSRAALGQEAEINALRARYASLSPREREVMALVVSGLLNKTGRRRARHERDHGQGAARQNDAKDAGRLFRRSGEDGHEVRPPARRASRHESINTIVRSLALKNVPILIA